MTRAEIAQAKYDKKYKALVSSLANNHFKGTGGRDKAREFIAQWVNKPCPYCGKIITVYNLQLDHKVPLMRSKIKNNEYSEEDLMLLNSDENITGCCADCNKAKGDLSAWEFTEFLRCLTYWEECILNPKRFDVYIESGHSAKVYYLSPCLASKQYILTKLKASALKYYGGKK
jgi:5-methylcytosine-specific restriction endonuclease McrA